MAGSFVISSFPLIFQDIVITISDCFVGLKRHWGNIRRGIRM